MMAASSGVGGGSGGGVGHTNNIISGSHINIGGGNIGGTGNIATNDGGDNNYHNNHYYSSNRQRFNHFNGFNGTSGAGLSGGLGVGNAANAAILTGIGGGGGTATGSGSHRANYNAGSGNAGGSTSGSQTIHITNRAVSGAASISGIVGSDGWWGMGVVVLAGSGLIGFNGGRVDYGYTDLILNTPLQRGELIYQDQDLKVLLVTLLPPLTTTF